MAPMKEATFRYAIGADGGGTRIELSMSFAFGMGPLGRVLEFFAKRMVQNNINAIAPRLARYWETGSAE